MVTKAIFKVLLELAPELVIVQGDTSSALGGALAATMAGVPLAHVEAGLRSHDRRNPWPEEEFRVAIDVESDLLFAATKLSAANLRRERVRGQVHITGNTGVDALIAAHKPVGAKSGSQPRLLVTCHRRENWHSGIDSLAAALRRIAEENIARSEVILHPNPAVSRAIERLLGGRGNITLRQPCSHSESIAAMLGADLLLSDSGGIQEESAVLGIPLLILREKTERPEALACGNAELVGTDCERIVAAVKRRLASRSSAQPEAPFGDGLAGERIACIVSDWLEGRSAACQPPCEETALLFPKASSRANA